MKYRLNKGFTLIELLVVISIIGVLSSIVLSSLSSAREKAKVSKIQQETNQLNLAFEIYYAEFGGYPFDGTDGGDGQYCISFDEDVECWRDGVEITARLEDMNGTIASIAKGINQYNTMVAAAVEFPRYREFVSFGSGTGSGGTLTQGYVYQECSGDPDYVSEVEFEGATYEVCTINAATGESDGPFLTYPYSSGGNVTIKGRVLGVPGEVNIGDGIPGCTDPTAINYNPSANEDDGNCQFGSTPVVPGCTDPTAINYNPSANEDDGNCQFGSTPVVPGCTDPTAINYNPSANEDDGNCQFGS